MKMLCISISFLLYYQVANYFNAILKKKAESNQLPDTARKKQQINIKDNFWLVTPRSKTAIEAWFKDLAGSKALTSLAKKVSTGFEFDYLKRLSCELNDAACFSYFF